MKRGLGVVVAMSAVALSLSPTPSDADREQRLPFRDARGELRARDFNWFGLGGCTVPVIGMPTDFDRVARSLPRRRWPGVPALGEGDRRQAFLVFVFVACPENTLETSSVTFERASVKQAMVGVFYRSGQSEDADKLQFYLLSDVVNWRRLARAESRIGLPSIFERRLGLSVARDPLNGLGTFRARVPRGRAPFSVTGALLAPNPIRELELDSAHFFDGPFGVVRVHHDETWAAGNAVSGVVTAPARSLVAKWMGATRREAQGIYFWDHHLRHVHRYQLME